MVHSASFIVHRSSCEVQNWSFPPSADKAYPSEDFSKSQTLPSNSKEPHPHSNCTSLCPETPAIGEKRRGCGHSSRRSPRCGLEDDPAKSATNRLWSKSVQSQTGKGPRSRGSKDRLGHLERTPLSNKKDKRNLPDHPRSRYEEEAYLSKWPNCQRFR